MRVLISGAGGMIGQAVEALLSQSHEVKRLVRDPRKARQGDVSWSPDRPPAASLLSCFDAIVHLAGSPVARRWSRRAKAEILNSRVKGTSGLAEAAAQAHGKYGLPHTFLGSSAIGYYGNRGAEELVEDSRPGYGFLSEVCYQWERSARVAAMAGIRVAQMRTSLVISPTGGALARMLPGFRLGLAGRLGAGTQWWSWISLEDAARAIAFTLENEHMHGPVNLSSPHPVTNAEFTETLGRVVGRPAVLAVPTWVLRLATGEMAGEMLLASQRVLPHRLTEAGFHFADEELEPALRRMLAPSATRTA
jgi:uncharacterized protein (TIGR01777 family)